MPDRPSAGGITWCQRYADPVSHSRTPRQPSASRKQDVELHRTAGAWLLDGFIASALPADGDGSRCHRDSFATISPGSAPAHGTIRSAVLDFEISNDVERRR